MRKIKLLLLFAVFLLLFFLGTGSTNFSYADNTPATGPLPCTNPASGTCSSIPTGLGISFPTDVTSLAKDTAGIALGISGVIALILIIYSGYQLILSQGNPEQVKNARDQLTAAIVGLLFIIFSLVLFQIIGVNILQLPGFGA